MNGGRTPTLQALATGAVLLSTLAGCGGPKSCVARGKVLVNGKPAEGVYLVFHTPNPPAGRPDSGSARTLDDGSFRVTLDQPGETVVTAFWPAVAEKGPDTIEGADRFDGAYRTGRNPAARATIREGDNEIPPIELNLPGAKRRARR
ncbi:MAG: hypothetical protein U0800_07985 [Isosphaeraceae bacterium]